MVNVLITDAVDEYIINTLKDKGFNVDYKPGINKEDLLKTISEYDALIVRSRTKVDKDIINAGSRLRLIARAGVGLDNIDVEYAKSKGIEVINAPEGSTESAAELTIGLMIAAARLIPLQNSLIKNGDWPKGKYVGIELQDKTLGIIGFGRIGQRVSTIAKALGMDVIAYDVIDISRKANELGVRTVSFDDLLKVSDIITIHVTLTPQSYHMIGPREFELMKNGVIIINTSRGEVIDTKALLNALNTGKIAAAALDVLEHEPPKEPWELELIKHPKVIITPHIGAETKEAQRRIAEILVNKIINILSKHPQA
ncbi:MAG: D-2-hydroxyacid dehydrogenase [Vulcanisaeta sp. AZ3]|jgi:D-3-phosphoglycerate dehydrogenase|nr:MAG: 3-phosphoglycerate dehydrogenase [Vulcanisaeta sp. AZ3]